MKIIFFGTSNFAVCILRELFQNRHNISSVVTAQDKKKGRGQKIAFSAVKVFAQKENLSILQPRSQRDYKFIQNLKNKEADLFVVCDYGKILSKDILRIPKVCAINLHASLLPKYRGAAPINWAIINGERETGATVIRMNEYMDRGEIILQQKIDIFPSDTAISLTDKLAGVGAKTLLKAVDLIKQGKATFTVQDATCASSAPKLKKEDGLIHWEESALNIHNRIRGLQPWPGAFTYLESKLLKIWQSQVISGEKDADCGEVVEADNKTGVLVQTGKDKLLITVLQLEGKMRMSAAEFILGHKIKAGKKFKNGRG